MSRLSERPLVIKFGGTSVGGGEEFIRAARIVAGAAQDRPVAVVVSAMSGTTDTLLGYADTTAGMSTRTSTGATHEGSIAELYRALAERHLAAARHAAHDPDLLPGVEERLLGLLKELAESLNEPAEVPAERRARVAAFGERLSAEILAGAIGSLGAPAAVTRDPIATDSCFDEAGVDAEATKERCKRYVAPLLEEGVVAVVPGYVGRSPEGLPTTLGRGGSDLSATVLGRALEAGEVWIMSDVDGVLSADPRVVPATRLVSHLSYREAAAFSNLGAKVLHPRTMEPVAEAGIEVAVRNTFNPECPGTRISDLYTGSGIRCVGVHRGLAVELPCTSGYRRRTAAVVCIGAPENADIARGMRCLRRVGISPLHAGITATELVFFVTAEREEEALRALHEGLVRAPVSVGGQAV